MAAATECGRSLIWARVDELFSWVNTAQRMRVLAPAADLFFFSPPNLKISFYFFSFSILSQLDSYSFFLISDAVVALCTGRGIRTEGVLGPEALRRLRYRCSAPPSDPTNDIIFPYFLFIIRIHCLAEGVSEGVEKVGRVPNDGFFFFIPVRVDDWFITDAAELIVSARGGFGSPGVGSLGSSLDRRRRGDQTLQNVNQKVFSRSR